MTNMTKLKLGLAVFLVAVILSKVDFSDGNKLTYAEQACIDERMKQPGANIDAVKKRCNLFNHPAH